MDTIPNHLLIESILVFIEPIELLQSLSLVSKRFASIIILNSDKKLNSDNKQIWKKLMEEYYLLLDQQQSDNNITNTTNTNLTIHQIQRLCLFITTPTTTKSSSSSSKNQQGTTASNSNNASSNNILLDREQQDVVEGSNNNNSNYDDFNKCILDYGSVLPNRGLAMHIRQRSNGLLRSCLASTTDQDSEIIENILFNDTDFFFRFFPINFFYWSSKPTEIEQSNEILLFTTKHPHTLISDISIKPLTDPDIPNKFYTWKNIQIKAYHLNHHSSAEGIQNNNNNNNNITDDVIMELPTALPSSICVINATSEQENNNNNNEEEQQQGDGDGEGQQNQNQQHAIPSTTRGYDECTIKRVLENQTPVYESIIHDTPPPNCVDWQNFILPKGKVIANVITITLIGKNTRQFHDSGYYACVQSVKIRGIPLYVNKEEQQQQQQQQQHHGAAGGGQGGGGKVLLLSGR